VNRAFGDSDEWQIMLEWISATQPPAALDRISRLRRVMKSSSYWNPQRFRIALCRHLIDSNHRKLIEVHYLALDKCFS
jgi:hypothetical protein